MYQYGVVAEIKQVMRVSDGLVCILVEGKFRASATELDTDGSFLLASVRRLLCVPSRQKEETEAEALFRNVKTSFDAVLSINPRIARMWCLPLPRITTRLPVRVHPCQSALPL